MLIERQTIAHISLKVQRPVASAITRGVDMVPGPGLCGLHCLLLFTYWHTALAYLVLPSLGFSGIWGPLCIHIPLSSESYHH